MDNTLNTVITSLHLPLRFETKLRADITYLLQYSIDSLEQIVLFGSCAHGQSRVTSDIDLLLITTTSLPRMDRAEISSTLEEALDEVHTDVVFYTREQFDDSNRLIVTQIKNEGVILYEK